MDVIDVDERVNLRNEFLRQGLDDVLVQVKKLYHLEDEPDLHTQIDVFEDELNSDKEELMGRYRRVSHTSREYNFCIGLRILMWISKTVMTFSLP